jgi:hypothetical protein
MSDDHKVNEALMKEIIITWLFKFGHDVILYSTIVNEMLDEYGSLDVDDAFEECCEAGYIDKIEEEKGYGITRKKYKLLNDGVELLNKGEKNEQ